MNIAAIIVGIDGWERYTLPLIESIERHEPDCQIVVIDNFSDAQYPRSGVFNGRSHFSFMLRPAGRYCYAQAINTGASEARELLEIHDEIIDWYIVLSNDVLCTGPFADTLAEYGNEVVGPRLTQTHGFDYIEGWCVAIPRAVWDAVGGWDERFLGSDWEDVAFSTAARQKGFWLVQDLPFTHLDQRQRYEIVDDFWGKDAHNRDLFMREYAAVTA